jgi:hypothetical protein
LKNVHPREVVSCGRDDDVKPRRNGNTGTAAAAVVVVVVILLSVY